MDAIDTVLRGLIRSRRRSRGREHRRRAWLVRLARRLDEGDALSAAELVMLRAYLDETAAGSGPTGLPT